MPVVRVEAPYLRDLLLFENLAVLFDTRIFCQVSFHLQPSLPFAFFGDVDSPVIVSDESQTITAPYNHNSNGTHLCQYLDGLPNISLSFNLGGKKCRLTIPPVEQDTFPFLDNCMKGTQQKARAEKTMARMGTLR